MKDEAENKPHKGEGALESEIEKAGSDQNNVTDCPLGDFDGTCPCSSGDIFSPCGCREN